MNFKSLSDFMKRSRIRKDVLGRIALAGRFDELHWQPRESLWAILEYQNLIGVERGQQMNFFKDTNYLEEMSSVEETQSPVFVPMQGFEKIQNDYNAFSLSTNGHPMQEMRKKFTRIPKMNSEMIRQNLGLKKISISGLVLIRQKPPTAKGVCFATMEDEFGFIDLVLWQNIFEQYKEIFLHHCFITVTGAVQRDLNTISVLVGEVRPIWTVQDEKPLLIEPHQYFY